MIRRKERRKKPPKKVRGGEVRTPAFRCENACACRLTNTRALIRTMGLTTVPPRGKEEEYFNL